MLAWIEHAADWEQNRRRGLDFPLQPAEAAIPPEEDAIGIDAAVTMREAFAQDPTTKATTMLALFDAVIGLLTGGERRH